MISFKLFVESNEVDLDKFKGSFGDDPQAMIQRHNENRDAHTRLITGMAERHEVAHNPTFLQKVTSARIGKFEISHNGNASFEPKTRGITLPSHSSVNFNAGFFRDHGHSEHSAKRLAISNALWVSAHEHGHLHHLAYPNQKGLNADIHDSIREDVRNMPDPLQLHARLSAAKTTSEIYDFTDTHHAAYSLLHRGTLSLGPNHGADYYNDAHKVDLTPDQLKVSEIIGNMTGHLAISNGDEHAHLGSRMIQDHFPHTISAVRAWHKTLGHID